MRSSVEQLSIGEQRALAQLYGTDGYKALVHLCKLEVEGLGKDALASTEHEQTRWLGGQANMAVKIPKIIRELSKATDKNKQKS